MRKSPDEALLTRGGLLEAGLAVFAEQGYAAARLEEIASRAGVTRGALYHHFKDKAELFRVVLGELWGEVTAPVFAELQSDRPPMERLERFMLAYLRAAERDERFRALLVVSMRTDAPAGHGAGLADKEAAIASWLGDLEAVLRQARRAGELGDGVTPRRAALMLVVLLNGATTTAHIAPSTFSPAREARGLAELFLAGIRP
jgi:TetR/AcrR family transcriptional regulator, acrAB operon repressor